MRDETGEPAIFAYLTRSRTARIELCDSVGRQALEELLSSGLLDQPRP
jgi:hypothetical protein